MNELKKDGPPLFSEIFYRSEKKFIEKKTKELIRDISLMLFAGIAGLIGSAYLLMVSGTIFDLISVLGLSAIALWIAWMLWLYFSTLEKSLTYIVITETGIKIIVGNRKIKNYIPKEKVQKITVNLRKKRIEIYLKDGNVIYSKRYDRRWMEHNFIYHNRFERFKKAMKEIGVEYEIIYA